jgi:hypothetical protein
MNPLDMDTAEIKILRAIDDVRAARSGQFDGRVSTVLGQA